MTRFQHVAVQSAFGPHTTLVAGIEMAGRWWFTTSADSAKVRMLRRHPIATVLMVGENEWTMSMGRATVLDVRHPLDGLADPVAAGLAGVAIARIGFNYVDQLLGYVADRNDVPDQWRPTGRVLVVVQHEHRLKSSNGRLVSATGVFADDGPLPGVARPQRRRIDPTLRASLTAEQGSLLDVAGSCVIGLATANGPVAIPGWWDPAAAAVAVECQALTRLRVDLDRGCSVTLDRSGDRRPSAKIGVMVRGDVSLLGERARADRGPQAATLAMAVLGVRTRRITVWDGFGSETRLAS